MKPKSKTVHLYGNWKMNPETMQEAEELMKKIVSLTKKLPETTKIKIAAPSLFVDRLVKQTKGALEIGVQNIQGDKSGAHTGDVSHTQALSIGASFTIIGHSERRALGETSEDINKKILASVQSGLKVVLCIGESVRDDHGDYLKEIKSQIVSALKGVDKKYIKLITIAYEPVWAIGINATGVATPVESLEVAILVRRTISDLYSESLSKSLVILYGGSANADIASGFLEDGGVQGFLLGRASLQIDEMTKLSKL